MTTKLYKRIHFFGDIFCDIIANVKSLPKWGGDSLAEIQLKPGGSCLNTLVHASDYSKRGLSDIFPPHSSNTTDPSHSEMKVDLAIFSAVGARDRQGELCTDYINHHIPSTNNKCIHVEGMSTPSCIVISGPEDRCFISDRGCIGDLSVNWFPSEELLACHHLHVTGYYNCTKIVTDNSSLRSILRQCYERNINTSLNTQYDATGRWDGNIRELCHDAHLTFFFCNEDELNEIASRNFNNDLHTSNDMNNDKSDNDFIHKKTKMTTHDDINKESDNNNYNHGINAGSNLSSSSSVELLQQQQQQQQKNEINAKSLLQWGCQHVIVTQGAQGVTAYYYSSNTATNTAHAHANDNHVLSLLSSVHQSAAHSLTVIDSTGAGDAFVGAFLVAWYHWLTTTDTNNNDISSTSAVHNNNSSSSSSSTPSASRCVNQLKYALYHGCVSGGSAVTLVGGSTVPTLTQTSSESPIQQTHNQYQDIMKNHMS